MRAIKFRAWDKGEEAWRYFGIKEILSGIYFGDVSALDVNHASDDKDNWRILCNSQVILD